MFHYGTLMESILVLVIVPLLNHIVLPCLPWATMKKRIGVGVFFFLLSVAPVSYTTLTLPTTP